MPNEEIIETTETAVPEAVEQLSPAEMFLQDMNAADAVAEAQETAPAPEAEAVAEAMGMPMEEAMPAQEETQQPTPAPAQDNVQDMRNTIAALLDIVKQNQAEKAAAAQERQASEMAQQEMVEEAVPEEEPFDEEAFNEEFYANPAAVIRNLAEKIADKNVQERLSGLQNELRPLLEESKAAQHRESVRKTLGDFLDNTPDANDYFNDIAAYINDNGLATDDPASYRDAYREAKIKSQQGIIDQLQQANAEGSRTLADYLADDNSVAQIIADDNIKSKVIENYLKELQEGGRPATISAGGSVQTPGNPARMASNMDDAGKLFLESLNR